MAAKAELREIVDDILAEIKEIENETSIVPRTFAGTSVKTAFRPLTNAEKKELVASLDARARKIIAELGLKKPASKA
jgi:hypothetical protein